MNSYEAFFVDQQPDGQVPFLVFVANPKDIIRWAHADDIKIDSGNVQRALVDSRLKQITKFFKASPNNVIPTGVTIAFDETVAKVEAPGDIKADAACFHMTAPIDGKVQITFSDAVKESSFIIDGQHRLRGMALLDFDAAIPVSLFLQMPKLERAFQFVTINNKAHKVPTDNLRALIANFDQIESTLRTRLTQASVTVPKFATAIDVVSENADSPFYRMIDWVNNRHTEGPAASLPPSAVEQSMRAIVRAFPEAKEDESDALSVLYAIWAAVFGEYGIDYKNAAQFPNLVLKASVQTLTEMIVEKLKSDYDPVFSDAPVMGDNGLTAGKKAKDLIKGIPADFWNDPWSLKSLDTSAGRELIERDIRTLKIKLHEKITEWPQIKSYLSLYKTSDQE